MTPYLSLKPKTHPFTKPSSANTSAKGMTLCSTQIVDSVVLLPSSFIENVEEK